MFLSWTAIRGSRVALLIALLATTSSAQTPPTRSGKGVTFEVTSVKVSTLPPGFSRPQWSGERLTVIGATLEGLILLSHPEYRIDRLVGGPTWVRSTRFDIRATVSDPAMVSTEAQRQQAIRALLEDRFGLILTNEVRDAPVYELVKARNDGRLGPGLRSSQLACGDPGRIPARVGIGQPISLPGPEQRPACGMSGGDGVLVAGNVTIGVIPSFLLSRADRVVIDRTGLTENFDVVLTYSSTAGFRPEAGAIDSGQNGPSIFTALEEQLGLKLQPTRTPLEFLVITRVEQPAPD